VFNETKQRPLYFATEFYPSDARRAEAPGRTDEALTALS
jgi:hypothetical protein